MFKYDMNCPQEARNDPNRLEPATNTDTDRYDVTDIQEGVDKPSHDLTFSKLIQQESMNGKPSFNYELQIRQHPSHDLAFSRPCQQDTMNREPSCNYELSQTGQPSDTKINSSHIIPTSSPEKKSHTVPPPESGETDYQLKVIFLGHESVGKTSLITRLMYNSYGEPCPPTIGSDILIKRILFHGRTIKLHLWDTAGQERYQSIISTYIRNSSIAVVVYDITDRKSFNAVEGCVAQVREGRDDNISVLIVGNKVDLQENRQIPTEEGKRTAKKLRTDFVETSAKTGCNVEDLLTRVVLAFIDMRNYPTNSHQLEAIQLTSPSQPSVKSTRHCCPKCCC